MTLSGLFQHLSTFRGAQYKIYKDGLPDSVRNAIWALVELFDHSSQKVREDIVSLVSHEISFLFFAFSTAMAVKAVQQRNEEPLIRGLEALAIENCVFDWRDSLATLALLHHSALKIGTDPEKLIKNVAILAMETAREKLFYPFLARTPEDRELTKFGVKEGKTASGEFTYVSLHQP
jgi:hypothetical protein